MCRERPYAGACARTGGTRTGRDPNPLVSLVFKMIERGHECVLLLRGEFESARESLLDVSEIEWCVTYLGVLIFWHGGENAVILILIVIVGEDVFKMFRVTQKLSERDSVAVDTRVHTTDVIDAELFPQRNHGKVRGVGCLCRIELVVYREQVIRGIGGGVIFVECSLPESSQGLFNELDRIVILCVPSGGCVTDLMVALIDVRKIRAIACAVVIQPAVR